MYQGFRSLESWKLGMEIVEDVYQLTTLLPKDEKFGIVSQMKRAAISIPLNIAEESSRNYDKVFIHFLKTAQGSASELHTLILLVVRLKMIDIEKVNQLEDKIDHVGRMINKFISSIEKK